MFGWLVYFRPNKYLIMFLIQLKQNSWIEINKTGCQEYSDTFPYKVSEPLSFKTFNFSIHISNFLFCLISARTRTCWWREASASRRQIPEWKSSPKWPHPEDLEEPQRSREFRLRLFKTHPLGLVQQNYPKRNEVDHKSPSIVMSNVAVIIGAKLQN